MALQDSQLHETLEEQLAALREQRDQGPPELLSSILGDIAAIAETDIAGRSLKVGARAPDFTLPDIHGNPVSLSGLLESGPVVVTFYRGAWCNYCDLQLRAYQRLLLQIAMLGATLVAISPQKVSRSRLTAESKQLTFALLSDKGNQVARAYGLVYSVHDALRQIVIRLGLDTAKWNDDDSWELPLPGTFVIDQNRTVRLAFVDPDYTRRLEPAALLEALEALAAERQAEQDQG